MEQLYYDKYCPNCNRTYKDFNHNYKFCPECGKPLKSPYDDFINKFKEELAIFKRNRCSKCKKDFDVNYKFCPICATELIKEEVFALNLEEKIIEGKWNDGLVKFTFDEWFEHETINANPPLPHPSMIFMKKSFFDELLEKEDLIFKQGPNRKLTYDQTYILFEIVNFMNYRDEKIEYHLITIKNLKENEVNNIFGKSYKIRKDLYLICDNVENIKQKILKNNIEN